MILTVHGLLGMQEVPTFREPAQKLIQEVGNYLGLSVRVDLSQLITIVGGFYAVHSY